VEIAGARSENCSARGVLGSISDGIYFQLIEEVSRVWRAWPAWIDELEPGCVQGFRNCVLVTSLHSLDESS
jgi:hypothetical protein